MLAKLYDCVRRVTPYQTRAFLKQQVWFNPFLQTLIGSTAYSAGYYQDIERLECDSTKDVADWLLANLHPASVLDVGCGPGHFMQAFVERGVKVMGVDYSRAAEDAVRSKNLRFAYVDLRSSKPLPQGDFDLVFCTEVAEHLEARYARAFVAHLTGFRVPIYLTAADKDPEYGAGLYHFNEQPNEYWINLMRQHDFALDVTLTGAVREAFRNSPTLFLRKAMIFRPTTS